MIQWLAKQANEGRLSDELARRFEQNAKGYRKQLAAKLGRQANTGRMIGNWAVLVTVYQLLARFWEEMKVEETLKPWQDTIFETVQRVQQERASEGFIQALNELLASGEVVLTEAKAPEEPRPGVAVVGYEDGRYIYLLPEIAYREAMRGRRVRVWRLKADLFGDSTDDGDLPLTHDRSCTSFAIFNGDSGDSGDASHIRSQTGSAVTVGTGRSDLIRKSTHKHTGSSGHYAFLHFLCGDSGDSGDKT